MRQAVALFAKAAEPGRVKTRLTARLTPAQAAAFHTACVQDCWQKIAALPDVEPLLFADRPWPAWEKLAGPEHCRIQRPGDLGARMQGCFDDLQAEGFERIAIIGSDSPTLPAERITQALSALRDDDDAALGPTEDGGYYLVACRRPHPEMFTNVHWSVETTLADTLAAFKQCNYRTTLLEEWWDIDTPKDLNRLSAKTTGPALREWLNAETTSKPTP